MNAWLTAHPYRAVIQLAAAPRPEGLGLKTGLRALSRYYNKFLRPDPAAQLAELIQICPEAGEKAAIHAKAALLAAKMKDAIDLDAFSLLIKYRRQLVAEQARTGSTQRETPRHFNDFNPVAQKAPPFQLFHFVPVCSAKIFSPPIAMSGTRCHCGSVPPNSPRDD